MNSTIAQALQLRHHPVALLWTDKKPEKALQFKEGKWGCVMWLAASAAKGRTAACDRQTFGCFGGGVGLGFGDQYRNFPGGTECFCHFLSTGNEQWEQGRQVGQQTKSFMTDELYDDFAQGERYLQSPNHVRSFLKQLPMMDIPADYVVLKPLESVGHEEQPQVIIFFADPDQISALTILANYSRDNNENVIIPYAAGCQSIGIYPYREAARECQRAVLGLVDISARLHINKQLGPHLLTFSVPFAMFSEMEANVAGSFLERPTWQHLMQDKAERSNEG